jgi:succinate dehydrogenase/fumarate reductase cytochrome b subunit
MSLCLFIVSNIYLKTENMKQVITGLFLTVSLFVNAQIINITYVTNPRENSETFLELHEKFINLSNSKERTITQSAIFAHAFAGNYTFPISL